MSTYILITHFKTLSNKDILVSPEGHKAYIITRKKILKQIFKKKSKLYTNECIIREIKRRDKYKEHSFSDEVDKLLRKIRSIA